MENINKKIIEIALKRCGNSEDLEKYLFPEKALLTDPFFLKGVKESCERIEKAVNNNERIVIYGDYDADGITSTALLYRAVSLIHDRVFYYIPERDGEGYGLNYDALDFLFLKNTDLIITVDCGIKSWKLVNDFKNKGLDFIITDHHTPDEVIPDVLIVNPRLSKENQFYDLAGVGVAFTLAAGLGRIFPKIKEEEDTFLQLAAIGTIADLVNLSMENRIITRKGIICLNRKPLQGIQSLSEINNINEINSKTIAFLIAPLINSSGRMESPETALKLLISEDKKVTDTLSIELTDLNNKRKLLVEKVYSEAREIILKNHYFTDPFILIEKREWPHGILGIVASKIMNEYNRPVMLLAESEEGTYKGSARSIDKYNLFDSLKAQEDLLLEFGGHSQAAGLSIKDHNISLLRKKLNLDLYESLDSEDFYTDIKPDGELAGIEEITFDMYKDLALLEPFGTGNPEPVFTFRDPVNLKLKKIGRLKDHLRIEASQDRKKIQGIYFNFQEYTENDFSGNLVFSIGLNEWQKRISLQLEVKKIEGLMKIHSSKMEQKIFGSFIFNRNMQDKNFTRSEKIQYNEVWNLLENSSGIIFSGGFLVPEKPDFLKNEKLYIYDSENNYPENFASLKRFISDKKGHLYTDSLLLKEEILLNAEKYVIPGIGFLEKIIPYIKSLNPEINIFILEDVKYNNSFNRDILSKLYLFLKRYFSIPVCIDINQLREDFQREVNIILSSEELISGIMIFEELGFLEYSLKNTFLEIKINNNNLKNNLENSRIYNIFNN